MNTSKIWIVILILIYASCSKDKEPIGQNTSGYKMLLIGNSFFRPYAENLDLIALDAGLENHSNTTVFRGGENGRPINFWNDSSSIEHNEIKTALDQGNIDIFGMTAGHNQDNPTEGFQAWITYALQKNPDITIFISIPPIDFPADWNQRAKDYGFNTIQQFYDYAVNVVVHKEIVDELRAQFPSTKIFTIPTGWAAIQLAQMKLNDLLLDEITMFGPKPTSIFTDQKGHQGQIVIETGTLIWLNSIYNVDLNTNDYETRFNTNLHAIAKEIMENHDVAYKK